MHGPLATRSIGGNLLDQWQYEVTAGGRIWYCPQTEKCIVWIVYAGTGHPGLTE
ncbi:hypothetical protein ABZ319_05300 [Nocardia sp. NPDC005978]|uniref:hypothetical protein n=1 Tax=Nocardia sp. NPDC005978 TaxID=3156725 RepID=UPI0033BE6879